MKSTVNRGSSEDFENNYKKCALFWIQLVCIILNLVRSTKKYNETYLASFEAGLTKETH